MVGCGPKNGEKVPGLREIPTNAKVILRVYQALPIRTIELPEKLRSRFIEMVSQEATYVDFSNLGAAPVAEFETSGLVFYWHGNSVVLGDIPTKGKVWTSPMMQALINRYPGYPAPQSTEEWKRLLDEVAAITNIDSTVVEGLGAYPVKGVK